MAKKPGIGRGLGAILPEASAGGPELRELPIELVEPSADQPRKNFDEGALEGLADSIREVGILQPLIVAPAKGGRFQIVAGERRWRAAGIAGLDKVPAVIRASSDDERLEAALIENMVREDLNPVEEARASKALIDDLGLSKEALGKKVGRSRQAISNLIRLLDLPNSVLELVESGELSEGHGRAVLVAPAKERGRVGLEAAKKGLSVRETEALAKRLKEASSEESKSESSGRISAAEKRSYEEAASSFARAIGRKEGVRVRRAGKGVRVEIEAESVDEILEITRGLGRGA